MSMHLLDMLALQQPRAVLSDSLRLAAEAALQRSIDSLHAVAARQAHALYDSALARSTDASAASVEWMGVFIGALGALFSVGAIVAGFLLWRQGNEFRTQRERLFAETRDELDRVILERNNAFEEWRASLEYRAEELMAKAASVETRGEGEAETLQRQQYEQALGELRGEIARLQALTASAVNASPATDGGTRRFLHFMIDGVPRSVVDAELTHFVKRRNSRMRWDITELSNDQILVQTSYRPDTQGASELAGHLSSRFSNQKVRRLSGATGPQ